MSFDGSTDGGAPGGRCARWAAPPFAHALLVRSLSCSPPALASNRRARRFSVRRSWISTESSTSAPTAVVKFVDRAGLVRRPSLTGSPGPPTDNDDPIRRWSPPRVIDRLPPQSLEAEQSVLGAILIDRDAVIEVAEFLRPADFYRQANGRIYAAVLELFERREPIDIVTVAETLERTRRARGGRWPRLPVEPLERDPDRRPRRPVRPDRRAQGGPAEPDRGGRADRRDRLRGPGRDPGGHRPRRGGAVRGQPEARRRRVQPAQVAPPRRLRPARLPPRPSRRDQRRPDRLRRPRHAHDRPPEERPDRGRRPPVASARRASRSTSPSTPPSASARASACSASR